MWDLRKIISNFQVFNSKQLLLAERWAQLIEIVSLLKDSIFTATQLETLKIKTLQLLLCKRKFSVPQSHVILLQEFCQALTCVYSELALFSYTLPVYFCNEQ